MKIRALFIATIIQSLSFVASANTVDLFENTNVKIHTLNTEAKLKKAQVELKKLKQQSALALHELESKGIVTVNENKVKQLLSEYKLRLNKLLFGVKVGQINLSDIEQPVLRDKVASIILSEENTQEKFAKKTKLVTDDLNKAKKEIIALNASLLEANNELFKARLENSEKLNKLTTNHEKVLLQCKSAKSKLIDELVSDSTQGTESKDSGVSVIAEKVATSTNEQTVVPKTTTKITLLDITPISSFLSPTKVKVKLSFNYKIMHQDTPQSELVSSNGSEDILLRKYNKPVVVHLPFSSTLFVSISKDRVVKFYTSTKELKSIDL
jgi:hypothetical protein